MTQDKKQNTWKKTPTGLYTATFATYKACISKMESYTSRKNNNYKGYYVVNISSVELDADGCELWGKHLGKRVNLNDAKALAEGVK